MSWEEEYKKNVKIFLLRVLYLHICQQQVIICTLLVYSLTQGPRRHYETGGSKSRIFSNFLGSPNFIYMIQKNFLCPPKSGGSVDPLDPLPTRALVKIQINNTFQNPRLKFWKCQKSLLKDFFLFIWLLISFYWFPEVAVQFKTKLWRFSVKVDDIIQ